MKQKLTTVLILMALSLSLCAVPAQAVSPSLDLSAGSITAEERNGGIVFTQNGAETMSADGNAIIRQSDTSGPTGNTITVSSGEVRLSIVDLNVSGGAPISVAPGANLTLTLVGSSTLDAGDNCAGIEVPEGATLCINGNGTVMVTGGYGGAGIGGAINKDAGTISIINGTVTANGGGSSNSSLGAGAGIGGGGRGSGPYNAGCTGGMITISGGTVSATGGIGGAGIGGGDNGTGGTISISGGAVTATAGGVGDYNGGGAGIGGGIGGDGGTITILGGVVTATGSNNYVAGGAGIGGGSYCGGGTITISGGTVIAVGGFYGEGYGGAGIGGGGYCGEGGIVSISDAAIDAAGYWHAIGGGGAENQFGCTSLMVTGSASITAHCASNYPRSGYSDFQERITDNTVLINSAALLGNNICFTSMASGPSGVSFQWQSSADGNTWTDVASQTAATTAIPMSASNDGYYYRCAITNGWGNVVYTNAAQAFVLAFTQQPQNVSLDTPSLASLSVVPSCPNVSYQWERSYDDGVTWTAVAGEKYATLIVDATLSENGVLYRCIITATNGDQLPSDAARITVTSNATTYTTRFYLERADGSGYDLADQVVTEASAGASVTAASKSFSHFTEDTAKGTHSGTVLADNSLILSRYYNRISYTITYETNGGTALGSTSAKFGKTISLPTPSKMGCSFDGWYRDAALKQAFTDTTMPGENLTLYAKWSVVGAGRGIEYRINSITLRDSSYQSINAIPRGTFYAEVSVTNLSSTTMDTLILATYDSNGKMLSLSFLYANPQIGQTFVLGTSFDNSNGEIAKIKAFMLPMLGGLTPLAEAMEYGG